MEKYKSLTISDTEINLYWFTVQEANAQNSENKEVAMDQGTSQDEQKEDDDETVENEVSYFFVAISNYDVEILCYDIIT